MVSNTAIQKAYERIHGRILSGDLKPGALLSEATLAKDLGVSRTPVGEALRELASVGLVTQLPRFGTIVRRIGRGEIIELYELREALEPYAVALAVRRITPDDIARLQILCEQGEAVAADMKHAGLAKLEGQFLRDFLATDMAFHTLLIHVAGNQRIAKLVQDSHVMNQLFGTQRLIHDQRIVAEACRYHTRILAAVRRGDAEAARALAAEHIRVSLAHTLENLDRYRSAEDAGVLPEQVSTELDRIKSKHGRARRPSSQRINT